MPTMTAWRTVIVYVLITLVSLAVALYGAEAVFTLSGDEQPGANAEAARAMGGSFDDRLPLQVILDLRSEGRDAWPLTPPSAFRRGDLRAEQLDNDLFPLSAISNVDIVTCNEGGFYPIYRTDPHGFANPPEAWRAAPLDIALIGDSFAFGACVQPDEGAAALLRREFPATISLGLGGNGPLVELAALREFLPSHAPRLVFWLFYPANDMNNLRKELKVNELARYLDPDHGQNLIARQAEVDEFLRQVVEDSMSRAERDGRETMLERSPLLDFLTIRKVRGTVGEAIRDRFALYPWDEFETILRDARDRTAAWGGQLRFVYLPSYEGLAGNAGQEVIKSRVLPIVERLGLRFIDAEAAFSAQPDPFALYPFKRPGHFNAEGYRMLARLLADAARPALTTQPRSFRLDGRPPPGPARFPRR
ncbi:MAG: GDSL-type esterase/lipase family protein [Dongiaceae bacterium]